MKENKTKKESVSVIFSKIALGLCAVVSFIVVASIVYYVITKKNNTVAIPPSILQIKYIRISSDAKAIINSETKKAILIIDDANKYLKDSGYAYDPDTFETTDAKYAGDCFLGAVLSNNKDRIVFSSGCLAGDLPQAWVGVYDFGTIRKTLDCSGLNNGLISTAYACIGAQKPEPSLDFLIGGSGKNFVWSQDDKTITYEADLGLSGLTETRTIDSATGEILERRSSIKTGKAEVESRTDFSGLQKAVDEGHMPWRLNPDMVLLTVNSYGFTDEDLKNSDLKGVLSKPGEKVYKIPHETNLYLVTLIQPVTGEDKIWIISEIKLDETADLFSETLVDENWKTYIDNYYNFSIKYPANWNYSDNRRDYQGSVTFYDSIEKEYPVFIIRTPIFESALENSRLLKTNKQNISDGLNFFEIKTYKGSDTDNYSILAYLNNSIEFDLSSKEDKFASNEKIFNEIISTFAFTEGDKIEGWNIYLKNSVDFTFQYPKDWKITSDYFYETAAGSKADTPTIILKRIGNDNIDDEIVINGRQYSCEGKIGKCVDLYGKDIPVYIGTHSIDSEILVIFDKILGSFKKIE